MAHCCNAPEQVDVCLQAFAGTAIAVVMNPRIVADQHAEFEICGEGNCGLETGDGFIKPVIRQHIDPAVEAV